MISHMAFFVIFVLILFNGLLSMAEIAIISIKKSRLKQLVSQGNERAKILLKLVENPNHFFSTVQVGITLIGVFTGVFGGATLSEPLEKTFIQLGMPQVAATSFSLILVVVILTYLSLVIGELFPKRIGLQFSEKIALWISRPMNQLLVIFYPIVYILSASTDFIFRLFQIGPLKDSQVSEEEVRMLIKEGERVGIFETAEKNIVEQVLNIGDAKVNSLMQSRNKVIWLNINASPKEIKDTILKYQFSYFPVADGTIDNLVGILRTDTYLCQLVDENTNVPLKDLLHVPLLIPENKKVLEALELFKRKRIHLGVIIDEYGSVEGIITLTDILEAIVGDIPDINEQHEEMIIKRENNSWLVDGLLPTAEFKERFAVEHLPRENGAEFNTIGGFVMNRLGRVPISGDHLMLNRYKIEVVDMDGNRVDKLMISNNNSNQVT